MPLLAQFGTPCGGSVRRVITRWAMSFSDEVKCRRGEIRTQLMQRWTNLPSAAVGHGDGSIGHPPRHTLTPQKLQHLEEPRAGRSPRDSHADRVD